MSDSPSVATPTPEPVVRKLPPLPPAPPSDRLRRWAILGLAACAANVAFLWFQHLRGWQHFLGNLFVILMLLNVLALLIILAIGAYRLAAQMLRPADLRWLLLGLLPLCFWMSVGVVAARNWKARYVPPGFLMRVARMSGAAMMEFEAPWRYQLHRSVRCLMLAPSLETAEHDAAQMDQLLGALERFTHVSLREPIAWVRGPLLGQRGLSLYGLALGTRLAEAAEANTANPDGGLPLMDRHEAAHAFLAQAVPPTADLPTILSEGWAEAVARGDIDPHRVPDTGGSPLEDARSSLALGNTCTLSALFGPDWYHQDSGEVYLYGRLLAAYLVNEFGAEKFLELCTSIRPGEVESVFLRIYGLPLNQIEAQMLGSGHPEGEPSRA